MKIKKIRSRTIRKILKQYPRKANSHKGSYGNVLVVAGSYGMIGAAVLTAKAVYKAGAGKVTVQVPHIGYTIVQTAVPEAIVMPDKNEFFNSRILPLENFDAIVIGPGLGIEKNTANILEHVLNSSLPVVIDADALTLLSNHTHLFNLINEDHILTPQPKEFALLLGGNKDDLGLLHEKQVEASENTTNIILKTYKSTVSFPTGEFFENVTGNSSLSTAGTGDVLAGFLGGFLAQGFTQEHAAKVAVFLHGLAGELAAKDIGERSVMATDVINYLGKAFLELKYMR